MNVVRKLYAYKVLADTRQTILFELGPNQFEDFRDIIGFFRTDPEEHVFFQIEKENVDKISPYKRTETRVKIELSDLFRSQERQVYTFITLMGDVGGFNGAVLVFPTIIMAYLSERMYHKEIAGEIPVKDDDKDT